MVEHAGVLGARSFVGQCVLRCLTKNHARITAFSRQPIDSASDNISWENWESGQAPPAERIYDWISAVPIWVLPKQFRLLEQYGCKRIVALSSTSRWTKAGSKDRHERQVARALASGESALKTWAHKQGIEWVILRPTLIYGYGRDQNITRIARFIRRFGFFPVPGEGKGLRQPIHCEDVGSACVAALNQADVKNNAFDLSGGETIEYVEMVRRIFKGMGQRERVWTMPPVLLRAGFSCARLWPKLRWWSSQMVDRMNEDLVFDHSPAKKAFHFSPRRFELGPEDLL